MSGFSIELDLPPHCDKCGRDHFTFAEGVACPVPVDGDAITKPPHKLGDENCFWRKTGRGSAQKTHE